MNNERLNFELRKIETYIKSFIKNNKKYSFKELMDITKNKFPEITSIGVKLNSVLENMEKSSELFRLVKDNEVSFLSTEFFKEVRALVEWQNKKQAFIYILDDKGNKTGETGNLSFEESESVIDGDIVLVKKIPEQFKEKNYEYILLSRLEKATSKFIGKVVEIERLEGKIISKCVLLERNFRFPIILDIVEDSQILPYFEGDFVKGLISSDSEFIRGEELIIDLTFVDRMGTIQDPKIETKMAFEWMNISRGKEYLSEEDIKSVIDKKNIVDKDRRDLTELNFISVDSINSKDLDDALYIEKLENGWRTFVAISDVSYYIDTGSKLDKVAKLRDQSYYLPHEVYPMLPSELSEDVLSLLSDGTNKKVLVIEILLDEKFNLKEYEIYPALIRNKARLTYSDIDYYAYKNGYLDEEKYSTKQAKIEYLNEEDYITTDVIENLLVVASNLRRLRGGDKTHYHDEFMPIINGYSGKVSNLKIIPRNTISGNMIEEFMLLGNKCAANFIADKKVLNPIFRNQEPPQYSDDQLSSAKYEKSSTGHYALSFDKYTHFTSPMRRYVDLRVHREIRGVLSNNLVKENKNLESDLLYSNKVSRRFKQAQEKALKWLIIEYLKESKERYFKSKIIRTLAYGWIIECEQLKLQAYISKPKDDNEVKYLESKDSIIVELHDMDFCKERLHLKIKTDKII